MPGVKTVSKARKPRARKPAAGVGRKWEPYKRSEGLFYSRYEGRKIMPEYIKAGVDSTGRHYLVGKDKQGRETLHRYIREEVIRGGSFKSFIDKIKGVWRKVSPYIIPVVKKLL